MTYLFFVWKIIVPIHFKQWLDFGIFKCSRKLIFKALESTVKTVVGQQLRHFYYNTKIVNIRYLKLVTSAKHLATTNLWSEIKPTISSCLFKSITGETFLFFSFFLFLFFFKNFSFFCVLSSCNSFTICNLSRILLLPYSELPGKASCKLDKNFDF